MAGLSVQYAELMGIAQELKRELGGAELTFTGHSLGGGLAEANSIATGDRAITFNGAGLSSKTSLGGKANADAYIMLTDPLNSAQTIVPGLSTAGINKHFLQPRTLGASFNPMKAHSIDSVVESLSTPTFGQQAINKLRRELSIP